MSLSEDQTPLYSIVVCTIGRPEKLRLLLESLEAQTMQNFEVLIVDQSAGRLDDFFAGLSPAFDLFVISTPRGLSRGRNAVLPKARGTIVAFPDDDCRYPAGLLQDVHAEFERRPAIAGLTVREVGDASSAGWGRWSSRPGYLSPTRVWTRTSSSALFLRRAVLEAVGGFDESLGLGAGTPWGSGEDTELPIRAIRMGHSLYYAPRFTVIHPSNIRPGDPGSDLRAAAYGRGIGRVWRMHRFPLWYVGIHLLRPLAGAAVALARRERTVADYYLASFRGRLAGWRS